MMQSIKNHYEFLTRSLGLLAVVGLILAYPVSDSDLWWHLASARAMLDSQAFLHQDPFPFAGQGTPWVNAHWGFQLVVYGVWALWGAKGLVALRALGWGLLLLTFRWALRGKASRPSIAVELALGAVLVFCLRLWLPERPVVLTLLVLAAMVWIWERWRLGASGKYLLWLFPLQVLLANVQPLSALGPAVAAAYLMGHWLSQRSIPHFLSALLWPPGLYLAGLCSPNGWQGLCLPFRHLFRLGGGEEGLYTHFVTENWKPWQFPFPEDWGIVGYLLAMALAIGVLFRREVPWAHRLLLLGGMGLGTMAIRNVPLLLCLALPLALVHLPWAWSKKRFVGAGAWALVVGLPAVALAWSWPADFSAPAPFRFPEATVQFLRKQEASELRVLCAVEHGGYLHWRGYPGLRAYIDGRLVLRDAAFFKEYLAAYQSEKAFVLLDAKRNFDLILVPNGVYPFYGGMQKFLARSTQWRLVHVEPSACLWARWDVLQNLPGIEYRMAQDSLVDQAVHELGNSILQREALFWVRGMLDGLSNP